MLLSGQDQPRAVPHLSPLVGSGHREQLTGKRRQRELSSKAKRKSPLEATALWPAARPSEPCTLMYFCTS